MKKFWETVSSRKLWAAVAACAGIYAAEGKAGLWKIVAIASAYIAAQGAVDVAAKINSPAK